MTRTPPDLSSDERLRQLLTVEARLQGLVQSAREEAARRVADEQAQRDHRLAASDDEIERIDRDEARQAQAAHVAALAALAAAHRAAMSALDDLPDTTIDELARSALRRAIDADGDRP